MKQARAIWFKRVFFLIVAMLSGSTSYMYFQEVFGAGSVGVATVAVGITGYLMTDGAAIAWMMIYLEAAENNEERLFAIIGAIVGVVGSLTATAMFILGLSEVVVLTADMGTATTIVLMVVLVVHCLLAVLSNVRSTEAQLNEKSAEMRADANAEMMTQTEELFKEMVPSIAQENAKKLASQMRNEFSLSSEFFRDALASRARKQVQQDQPLQEAPAEVDEDFLG